ncbi:putative VirB6/TrlB type IV secretion protein [Candidatus Fokinia solitaria]|uniref:Putative VirB6/TrlB type IV secretion protein n=1 Tax=Candidatus Fokinia solitaria TaxID=1802984 RepID=A0A2U8BSF2_9RICK|nr:putative VirB6/TrlB type IV secretion protein [Candidatus Fokinia solitaria]
MFFIGCIVLPRYSIGEELSIYSKCIFGYDNRALPQEVMVVTPHGCQDSCNSNCSIFNQDIDQQNFSACYSYCVQGLPYVGNPVMEIADSIIVSDSSTICASQYNKSTSSSTYDCTGTSETVSQYYYGNAISAAGCPNAVLLSSDYTPPPQQASSTFSYPQGAKYSEMEMKITFEKNSTVCPNGNLYVTLLPIMSNLFQRAPEAVTGGNAAANAINNNIYNRALNFSFAAKAINAVTNFGTSSSDASAMGEWCPDIDSFQSCLGQSSSSGTSSSTVTSSTASSNTISSSAVQQNMMHPCFAGLISSQPTIANSSVMGTSNVVTYLYNVDLSYIYGSDIYNPQANTSHTLNTIVSEVNSDNIANLINPIVGCFPEWRLNGPAVPIARSISEEAIPLQAGDDFSVTWGGDVFVTGILYNENGLLMPLGTLNTTGSNTEPLQNNITDLRDLVYAVMIGDASTTTNVLLQYNAAVSSCKKLPPSVSISISSLLQQLTALTISSQGTANPLTMMSFSSKSNDSCGSYKYCRTKGSGIFEFCTKSEQTILGLNGSVQQTGYKIQTGTKSQDRKEEKGDVFHCKHVLDPGLPVYTFSGKINTTLPNPSIQMPSTYVQGNDFSAPPQSASHSFKAAQCYNSSSSTGYLGFAGGYQATIQWCGNPQVNGQGLQIAIADPSISTDSLQWNDLSAAASATSNTISIGGAKSNFVVTNISNGMVTIGESGIGGENIGEGTLDADINYNIYFRLDPKLYKPTINSNGYITYPPTGQYNIGISQGYRGSATLSNGTAPQNISWPQKVIKKLLTLMFGSNICSIAQSNESTAQESASNTDIGAVWIIMNGANTVISRYIPIIIIIAIMVAGIGFLAGTTKVTTSEVMAVIARLIIVVLLVQPNTILQNTVTSGSKNSTLSELVARTSICSGVIAASYVTPSISSVDGKYQYTPSLNGIFEVTLETWYVLTSQNTWLKVWSLAGIGLSGLMFAGVMVAGLVYSLILVCFTMLTYIYLVIGLAAVTAPMPLFAICLLFSSTRTMAYQYGKKFICFALYNVVLSAGVTLIDVVITTIILSALSFTICDAVYQLKILVFHIPVTSWVPLLTVHSPVGSSTLLPLAAVEGGIALCAVGHMGTEFVQQLLRIVDKIVDPYGGSSDIVLRGVNRIVDRVKGKE